MSAHISKPWQPILSEGRVTRAPDLIRGMGQSLGLAELAPPGIGTWLPLLSLLIAVAPGRAAAQGAADFYINNGTAINVQVDAINFVNNGLFQVFPTIVPYEPSEMQNFTNSGTMISVLGWQFDNAPATNGQRQLAANFHNRSTGLIQSFDVGPVLTGGGQVSLITPDYLFVSATNIINKGTLMAGANGWLQLTGTNIDLARSGVEVAPIQSIGSFNALSNYFPDVAISDVYWAITNTGFRFDSSGIWDGFLAVPPAPYTVTYPGGFSFGPFPSVFIVNPVSDSVSNVAGFASVTLTNFDQSGSTNGVLLTTNVLVPNNIIKQAVFVGPSPNMVVQTGFLPGVGSATFSSVGVVLTLPVTNAVTTLVEPVTIYVEDDLASLPGRTLAANILTGNTFRPVNYIVERSVGVFGSPGLGTPNPNFFCDPTITTSCIVTGALAAYAAGFDNIVSRPPPVPGNDVTNLPGRIRIFADSLDLTRTRLRGEGEVVIQTRHLVGSTNAVIDCENLSYDLGSTNGNLHVVNLTKPSVQRVTGEIALWSSEWTNTATVIVSNNFTFTRVVQTNGSGGSATNFINPVPRPLSVTVRYTYHAMLLDASAISTTVPVTVYNFATHSTNVVVSDNMTVVQSLLIDGQSFTLNGNLTLSGVANWVSNNAPSLLYFTNHGALSIPNEGHFGDDRSTPYAAFVNTGSLSANSETIDSGYFDNEGLISARVAGLDITTASGKSESGQFAASSDVQFRANVLKFNQSTLQTGGRLDLVVTNSLLDAGGASSNVFICGDGFSLPIKPQTGDLLGTTFESGAPAFVEVDHVWAAHDFGPVAAGYSDNEAVGQLVLQPQTADPNKAPLFFFTGTGGQNALYLDLLDITALDTNFQNMIEIDPSLVIYYAAAKLGFTPPPTNGVSQEPEEFLNGQFDGHLQWAANFAGPNSSVAVVSNGVSILVNRALRFSKIIDSNGNGIPNFYDTAPFDTPALQLKASLVHTNPPPAKTVTLSWPAVPNAIYHVEFTTNVNSGNWQPLLSYTNNASTNRMVTVLDPNAPTGAVRRFYRVSYSP